MITPVKFLMKEIILRSLEHAKTNIGNYFHTQSLGYKRYRCFSKILATAPIFSSNGSSVELFLITSHADFIMSLLAIKSFIFFAKCDLFISILDDGTLTTADATTIRKHIKNVNYISGSKFNKTVRQSYGTRSKIYAYKDSYPIRKNIGIHLCTRKEKIILMDSDVFFFKKPLEIMRWINGNYDGFYIKDCNNAYVLSHIEARSLFHVSLQNNVNSGLIGICKKDLDIKLNNRLIRIHDTLSKGRHKYFQTYFSLLFSRLRKIRNIKELPRTYFMSEDHRQYHSHAFVCVHLITPVRRLFYEVAEKVLQKMEIQ